MYEIFLSDLPPAFRDLDIHKSGNIIEIRQRKTTIHTNTLTRILAYVVVSKHPRLSNLKSRSCLGFRFKLKLLLITFFKVIHNIIFKSSNNFQNICSTSSVIKQTRTSHQGRRKVLKSGRGHEKRGTLEQVRRRHNLIGGGVWGESL